MRMRNEDMVGRVFGGVEYRGTNQAHDTLLSIDKARRELGYDPKHTWRHG